MTHHRMTKLISASNQNQRIEILITQKVQRRPLENVIELENYQRFDENWTGYAGV